MSYSAKEESDWFDLNIEVAIGEFKIPFKKFLGHIRRREREYPLPDKSLFYIPEEWFAMGDRLDLAKRQGDHFQIKKYQLDVLEHIKSKRIKDHLKKLVHIQDEQPTKNFAGVLRPYQLEGLSWLMFLYNNRFGGILAEDMGLGKTVQTLAYIQRIRQLHQQQRIEANGSSTQAAEPILLVAPTSLLFNWKEEAGQFTPGLSVMIHSGINRSKQAEIFNGYDLVITSYGLIRNDF